MPRLNRAHGRPGTRMIPAGFEAEHARVMEGSRTAMAVIHGPASGERVFDPDLGYSVTPDAPLLLSGPIRVQALTAADRTRLVGEQEQITGSYLVAVTIHAPAIPPGSVITFTQTTDEWLADNFLTVRNGDLGSVRFERHLYAVDDTTDSIPSTDAGEEAP